MSRPQDSRYRGLDVSDDVLSDIAFEIRQRASYIGWTDPDMEDEYLEVAEFLEEQKSG